MQTKESWPQSADVAWLMFNGIGNIMPEKHPEIIAWAADHQVIVADATHFDVAHLGRTFSRIEAPVRLLELSEFLEHRIHVEFHAR